MIINKKINNVNYHILIHNDNHDNNIIIINHNDNLNQYHNDNEI